ncbi:adenylate kinase family protein [Halovivax gelatinilyticus]|uniref:adenylate kinase family protein n=1 Tax=Halovivax gelatinilyticus TaxID=2961597 RepID=UPI0020CA2B93|nr:adenylate kinase family protein [Halovivax gelatinilyticus]
MRVAITGTPGTGKTTATKLVHGRLDEYDVVHVNDVIETESLYTDVDEERDSVIADIPAIERHLDGRDDVVFESHLAHHLPADRVVVLRCAPADLEARLTDRGESDAKARENAESEALDVILAEAVDQHGFEAIYEIETTDAPPEAVADEIEAVISGERAPSAGDVDYVGYLA